MIINKMLTEEKITKFLSKKNNYFFIQESSKLTIDKKFEDFFITFFQKFDEKDSCFLLKILEEIIIPSKNEILFSSYLKVFEIDNEYLDPLIGTDFKLGLLRFKITGYYDLFIISLPNFIFLCENYPNSIKGKIDIFNHIYQLSSSHISFYTNFFNFTENDFDYNSFAFEDKLFIRCINKEMDENIPILKIKEWKKIFYEENQSINI